MERSRNTKAEPGVARNRARERRMSVLERCAVAAVLVAVAVAAIGPIIHRSAAVSTVPVSVERGQSLWEIAQAHPIDGRSTAETVEYIIARNGLDDSTLQPGTALQVPATASDTQLAMR